MTELEQKLLKALKNLLSDIEGLMGESSGHLPIADADGWLPWEGGDRPVYRRTKIRVRYRDGYEEEGLAMNWTECWKRMQCGPQPDDIIAYRIVGDSK